MHKLLIRRSEGHMKSFSGETLFTLEKTATLEFIDRGGKNTLSFLLCYVFRDKKN